MATKPSKESSNDSSRVENIPDILHDPKTNKRYTRGRFLGKGGFARCYELTDMETKQVFAGKIVSKTMLVKQHQKDKMAQEIAIHRSLKQSNIVNFICFFEDNNNVYIILEICRRRSLMELHKRRKAITEPETRYFMKQLVTACHYLHSTCNIIHRDLKLGNLFLNDEMELKIGDFGLATRVDFIGERKKTLCGTPNYIAPEVLNKKGHSYEVDVWSIGCIMYTLLVGRPPFETSTLKDTYMRIKNNEYHVPSRINPTARNLIQKMLQSDPTKRPTMEEILQDDFMTNGYVPSRLPTTCLTVAPRFDQRAEFSMIVAPRKPLIEVNVKAKEAVVQQSSTTKGASVVQTLKPNMDDEGNGDENGDGNNKDAGDLLETPDFHMDDLYRQLAAVLASKPAEKLNIQEDEAEDPAASPMLWVSKWVDYSDKYGLGYQLCDNSVGVLFNDCTKILLLADGDNIHYIERHGAEHYHSLNDFPETLTKKVTLLKYFRNYMNEHLLKTGAAMVPREGDELARLPYLRYWFRTRNAIVLHLTNGTLQINFFQDHTKVIVCPLMNAVTYIDEKREIRTFRMNAIEKFGCSRDLCARLRYARTMVERLKTLHANPSNK